MTEPSAIELRDGVPMIAGTQTKVIEVAAFSRTLLYATHGR